jgi:hypothetical protein
MAPGVAVLLKNGDFEIAVEEVRAPQARDARSYDGKPRHRPLTGNFLQLCPGSWESIASRRTEHTSLMAAGMHHARTLAAQSSPI